MGAGMPLNTTNGANSNKRWWLISGGTFAVLVAGAVASQFWLAKPGAAANEEKAGASKAQAPRKAAGDRIVAKVNKEAITEDMLAKECMARHGKEVLDELINRLIIQQACEAEGKQVTQDEVEQEIVNIAKRFNLDPVQWQQMLQSERNITPEQYRLSVIWPMLALRKLAESSALDEVTDADVEKEFQRQYGERVKCRLILLDNQRHATDVWNKCRQNPEEFEELAQKHSIDPNSKALGGTIPPIPRFSGNDAIEKAAFKLKDGALSGLIEVPTPGGMRYAILKSEGKTEPVVNDIEEVREQLVEELKERRTQENVAKVFERIKQETSVDNYLAGTTTRVDSTSGNPAARPAPVKKDGSVKQTSAEKPAGTTKTKSAAGKASLKQ